MGLAIWIAMGLLGGGGAGEEGPPEGVVRNDDGDPVFNDDEDYVLVAE